MEHWHLYSKNNIRTFCPFFTPWTKDEMLFMQVSCHNCLKWKNPNIIDQVVSCYMKSQKVHAMKLCHIHEYCSMYTMEAKTYPACSVNNAISMTQPCLVRPAQTVASCGCICPHEVNSGGLKDYINSCTVTSLSWSHIFLLRSIVVTVGTV